MIVLYALNTQFEQRIYYKCCFSKQTFSLTKKISKPLSARPQAAPFFVRDLLYAYLAGAAGGSSCKLQSSIT